MQDTTTTSRTNGANGTYGTYDRNAFDPGSGLSPEDERTNALNKFRSAGSVSMSPELFEKLYLSPQNMVKGNLRGTFGNPTPM
jgi:hypothetical protein